MVTKDDPKKDGEGKLPPEHPKTPQATRGVSSHGQYSSSPRRVSSTQAGGIAAGSLAASMMYKAATSGMQRSEGKQPSENSRNSQATRESSKQGQSTSSSQRGSFTQDSRSSSSGTYGVGPRKEQPSQRSKATPPSHVSKKTPSSQGSKGTPSPQGPKEPGPDKNPPSSDQGGWSWRKIACVAAGAVGVVALAPVAVAAAGFGAGGIAAGSLAASMMSTAATSGVGMGAVSVLQSVGAVGFSLAGNAGLATAGAAAGGFVSGCADKLFGKGNGSNEGSDGKKPKSGQEQQPAQGEDGERTRKKNIQKNKKKTGNYVEDDEEDDSNDEFYQHNALEKRK